MTKPHDLIAMYDALFAPDSVVSVSVSRENWLAMRGSIAPEPSEHPALAAGDVLAHQLTFKYQGEILEAWWQARGGHDKCTVCAPLKSSAMPCVWHSGCQDIERCTHADRCLQISRKGDAATLWDCSCNLTSCPYCGPRLVQKSNPAHDWKRDDEGDFR